MFAKSKRSIIVGMMTFIVILLVALPSVFAQTNTPTTKIEMIGEIQALTANTLTINGQLVNIRRAEINVRLAVGQLVKVEGTLAASGTIMAREVGSVDEDEIGRLETELIGSITTINGDLLTIGGFTVDTSTAEIQRGLTLRVGLVVKVHMSLNADEVWVAREVESPDADDLNEDDSDDDDVNDDHGGNDDDSSDDNSGSDSQHDDDDSSSDDDSNDDDHSGSGSHDDDDNEDNSGPGSHDDDDD